MDIVIDWRRQMKGEHPNWDEFRREVLEERRIALRVRIEKVGSQRRR
jgi:hypothetical protein